MVMTRGQHLIGKVLGSCKLEKLLGYGGSSAVFLAQQHEPDRKVAVKVFLPRSNMDVHMQREFYARFLREAEAASQLDHEHILPIHSYGEQDGLPYIVMPYMSGGTLSEYSAQQGPLSLQEAQWYLEQIASALDYAHKHGCVHCDVKPANILLDSDGCVMLSDFGIARVTQAEGKPGQTPMKNPESLMGTPDYISPEQALGLDLDGRSDTYSLAITLFYLLARRLPFRADSTIALALLHIHETPPSLCNIRVDVTRSIDGVVCKALAKNPDERFQSAGAFSSAFAQAVTQAEQTQGVSPRRPVLGGSPGTVKGGLEPEFVAAKATVRVKPVWVQNMGFPRLLMLIGLLIVVLSGGVFAASLAISRMAGSNQLSPNTLANHIDGASTDFLLDRNAWPASSTFFYDASSLYHILNKSPQNVALALYGNHRYNDFSLTVTMQEISNLPGRGDYYGVVFRCSTDQSHYYLFEVETSGDEVTARGSGAYVFLRYDSNSSAGWSQIATGAANALVTGAGKHNIVTINASGNTFAFAINNKSLGASVTDTSKAALVSGQVGLYVEAQGTEVAFSHFYVKSQVK